MYEEQRRVCRFHAERSLKARAENRVFRSGNLKGGFSLQKNHTINREIATNDTKKIWFVRGFPQKPFRKF
jgi:hypothetical protein